MTYFLQKQLGLSGGLRSGPEEQLMMRQFPPAAAGAVPPVPVPPGGAPGGPLPAMPPPPPPGTSPAASVAGDPSLLPPNMLLRPAEPKFAFSDINTTSLNGIVPHIYIDSRLTLLKEHPDLVQLVKISIEKSIQEWAVPVIERAIKIAVTTCEQIVKKDHGE